MDTNLGDGMSSVIPACPIVRAANACADPFIIGPTGRSDRGVGIAAIMPQGPPWTRDIRAVDQPKIRSE